MSYMYLPDRETPCGTDWTWDTKAGDSYKEIRVFNELNDVGARACAGLLACHAVTLSRKAVLAVLQTPLLIWL